MFVLGQVRSGCQVMSCYVKLGHFTSGNDRSDSVNPCCIKFGHVSSGYCRLEHVRYV
jgi:hypothetical protein